MTSHSNRFDYERNLMTKTHFCGCYRNWNEFMNILNANRQHHQDSHVIPREFTNNILSKMVQYEAPQHVIDTFLKTCHSPEQGRLLMTCCKLGASFDTIEQLLNINPNIVDMKDQLSGRTPLSHAVALDKPNPGLVKVLLEAFPNMVLVTDNQGKSPLHWSVTKNTSNKSITEQLVAAAPNTASISDNAQKLPLHYLCARKDATFEEMSVLLEAYPESALREDNQGKTPLHYTWECFEEFGINDHGDFASNQTTAPLLPKIFLNRYLSDLSSRVHMLLLAATTGSISLDEKSSNDGNGTQQWRPIDAAASIGSKCPWIMFEFLLKLYYGNSEQKDYEGRLPLHVVARAPTRRISDYSKKSAIQVVVESFSEAARITDNCGRLPLHIAAARNISEMGVSVDKDMDQFDIDTLIKSFPDGAKHLDRKGRIPLHHAIAAGRTWNGGGVESIFNSFPEGLTISDPITRLSVFMLSASVPQVDGSLDTVYHLLRADPTQVKGGIKETEDDLLRKITLLEREKDELELQVAKLKQSLPKL